MNFSFTQNGPLGWKYYGSEGGPPSTMDAILEGKRTSTLRKGLPRAIEIGDKVTFFDSKAREAEVVVTGRRYVDPSMAEELSETELWTPEFLTWYMNKNGLEGGKMEQLLYSLSES
jgi:hypothetical protein